jgi:integrase
MRGDGKVYQRGPVWWIDYYVNGKRFREAAGRTEKEAQRKLRRRRAKALTGTFTDPREERTTVNELLDAMIVNLETRGRRSLASTHSHLKPIREAFGHYRALSVTAAELELYARDQQETKANATVNRGLQGLRAAYRLAVKQARLSRAPHFPMLREDNVRRGFFEAEDFERFVQHLPEGLADAARFAYRTGWRRGEVVGLTWENVDRAARELRLHTSKNGHGRVLPLVGPLWELIEKRHRARVLGCPSVFHNDGVPLGDIRKAWSAAAKAAKLPGVLFHDLRRTAARNMVRAGVPETVAMSITGHKTRAMFDRYNITSQADQRLALERVHAKS